MRLIQALLTVSLTAIPAGAQQPEDPYEAGRRSVREGMERAIQDQRSRSEESADPEIERLIESRRKGYGAEPEQMMRQALDMIGSSDTAVPSERNLRAMGMVYSYYVYRGDFDRARKAAIKMARIYENAERRYGTIERLAADAELVRSDDAAPIAVYANIHQAGDLRITHLAGGGYRVDYVDRDGLKAHRILKIPKEVAANAMGFPVDTFDDDLQAAIRE